MLVGSYQVKVAQGRRVFIPSQFRVDLGEQLILAKWYEQCLVVVSVKAWKALYNRLTGGRKVIIAPIRDTERFILGSAYQITCDEQGRIVVPEVLSSYAKLGSEISFVGLGDRVEVWDSLVWTQKQENLAEEAAGIIERMSKNG